LLACLCLLLAAQLLSESPTVGTRLLRLRNTVKWKDLLGPPRLHHFTQYSCKFLGSSGGALIVIQKTKQKNCNSVHLVCPLLESRVYPGFVLS